MDRAQATFGIGGTAFGFVAGFVLAYALTAPATMEGRREPVPPPPIEGRGAAAPGGGGAAAAADPHDDVTALIAGLKEKLALEPDDVSVLLNLAELYLRAGMAEQAEGYLEHVLKIEPQNGQAQLYTAMAMEGLDRGQEARELLERMAKVKPVRWEVHYLLAVHFLRDPADPVLARRELDQLEKLNPSLPSLKEMRDEVDRIEAAGAPTETGSG